MVKLLSFAKLVTIDEDDRKSDEFDAINDFLDEDLLRPKSSKSNKIYPKD